MNSPLFRAIVDAAAVFELTDDERLDPDLGVAALESMSAALQGLEPDLRRQFCDFVASEADAESDPERAEFLAELVDNLGLDTEEE